MNNNAEIISTWAAKKLLGAPLAVDSAAAAQVWSAVADLRSIFVDPPADVGATLDTWFDKNFMNAPPLSHNTPAFNQVNSAFVDLRKALLAVPNLQLSLQIPEPQPAPPAPNTEQE